MSKAILASMNPNLRKHFFLKATKWPSQAIYIYFELLHLNKHVEENENLSSVGFKLILFCRFVNVNAEKKYSSVLFTVNFYSIRKLDTFMKLILNRISCLNEKILTFYGTVSQIIVVSGPPQ